MKPNIEQKQWLRNYLNQTMEYRETFNEVYDHILLALENEGDTTSFETAVAKIITEDFGNNGGLYALEQNCRDIANDDIARQYQDTMHTWIKSSHLIFTGLIALSLGVLLFTYALGFFMLFNFFGMLIPVALFLYRKFKMHGQPTHQKESLKAELIDRITFKVPLIVWVLCIVASCINLIVRSMLNLPFQLLDQSKPTGASSAVNGLFFIGLLTWMILHLITIYKMYQSEFKPKMVTT